MKKKRKENKTKHNINGTADCCISYLYLHYLLLQGWQPYILNLQKNSQNIYFLIIYWSKIRKCYQFQFTFFITYTLSYSEPTSIQTMQLTITAYNHIECLFNASLAFSTTRMHHKEIVYSLPKFQLQLLFLNPEQKMGQNIATQKEPALIFYI